jgi:hypothetical protein
MSEGYSRPLHGIVEVNPEHLIVLNPHASVGGTIAPGFRPRKSLNLKQMGGRTIRDLSFLFRGGRLFAVHPGPAERHSGVAGPLEERSGNLLSRRERISTKQLYAYCFRLE